MNIKKLSFILVLLLSFSCNENKDIVGSVDGFPWVDIYIELDEFPSIDNPVQTICFDYVMLGDTNGEYPTELEWVTLRIESRNMVLTNEDTIRTLHYEIGDTIRLCPEVRMLEFNYGNQVSARWMIHQDSLDFLGNYNGFGYLGIHNITGEWYFHSLIPR